MGLTFEDIKENSKDIEGAEEFFDLNKESFDKFLDIYNNIDEEIWEEIREANEREDKCL